MNYNEIEHQNDASGLSLLSSSFETSSFLVNLSILLGSSFQNEKNEIYFVNKDLSVSLYAIDGKSVDQVYYPSNEAVFSYIQKIKKPYFTNSASRDPLFSSFFKKRMTDITLDREMIYPIIIENRAIIYIHMRSSMLSYGEKDFLRMKNFLEVYHSAFLSFSNKVNSFNAESKILTQNLKQDIISSNIEQIIGLDKRMQLVRHMVEKASGSDFPVLIEGGLGVGKRFIARKIHQAGVRSSSQAIIFECGVRDEDSLEKELFGFMDRVGMIEHAHNGTLILSDVNELPLSIQSKLVQFMTSGWSVRVNGKERMPLNVRIIATSRVSLSELVASKKFREDLFYRFGTLNIKIPALMDRKDDIKLLADHFLNAGKSTRKYLSGSVLRKLEDHQWGANILELKSIMERAYMLTEGECVDSIEISSLRAIPQIKHEEVQAPKANLEDEEITLFELEKKFIFKALVRWGGNKTKTAKALGITVKTLYNKLHSYGIEFEDQVSALN